MAHLNFEDFYQVPDLKFNVSKMRADLDTILKKKEYFGSVASLAQKNYINFLNSDKLPVLIYKRILDIINS